MTEVQVQIMLSCSICYWLKEVIWVWKTYCVKWKKGPGIYYAFTDEILI